MGEKPSGNNEGSSKGLLRVFIAIDMPKAVRDEIGRLQKTLYKLDLFEGTYVNQEHAHLTLQFIGYIEPVALAPIKKLLATVSFKPIKAKLGAVGAFGNRMFIKVIWLELVSPEIIALTHDIEKVLSLGTLKRKRPFRSHVTLARVKKVSDLLLLRAALETIKVEPISFTIKSFVLKQSTLTSQGPIYIDLERYGDELW